MRKTTIKNLETNIEKKCDILKKNDKILEVVIENTTIKLTLFKKSIIRIILCGPLAQLVEQFPFKEWVDGSSPSGLTKFNNSNTFSHCVLFIFQNR